MCGAAGLCTRAGEQPLLLHCLRSRCCCSCSCCCPTSVLVLHAHGCMSLCNADVCLPPVAMQVGKMHFGYILGWMVVGSGLLWCVQRISQQHLVVVVLLLLRWPPAAALLPPAARYSAL